MSEQANKNPILEVVPSSLETTAEKVTILGAASVFASMVDEAKREGNEGFAHACGFAAHTLEQMVLGNLPVLKFENPEAALKEFTAAMEKDALAQELEQMDNQEEPTTTVLH